MLLGTLLAAIVRQFFIVGLLSGFDEIAMLHSVPLAMTSLEVRGKKWEVGV